MRKIKKSLAVFLSLLMAFAAFGVFAYADDDAVTTIGSGTCGKDGGNLTWTLTSDGVITISGEGEMADFVSYEDPETHETVSVRAPWAECVTDILVARLGYESVEDLEAALMSGEVDMPAYMTAAMEYDSFFKKVVIQTGVTSVGAEAFYNIKLDEASLPATLTALGIKAFNNCGLAYLVLPNGLKTIGEAALSNNDFTELTVPASVETVGYDFISGCASLHTLTWLSDVSLEYVPVPTASSDFPFTTYEQYSAYSDFYGMLELLMELLCRDYNVAQAVPQYMYYYNMTAEEAETFMDAIYTAELLSEATKYDIPATATNEQACEALLAKINETLGTAFTLNSIFVYTPALAISPALFMDVYQHGSSSLSTLLTAYYTILEAIKLDRTAFKTKTGKTDTEIDNGLIEMYAELDSQYGISAAGIDEAISGIVAFVNTLLGKTGDDAYTETTLGTIHWACASTAEGVEAAAMLKFGLETYPGYVSVYSGYINGQQVLPWFTVRTNCDNANVGFLTENEVSFELLHTIVEHAAQAPTCVDKGWDAYETCEKCDYTTRGEDIDATGIHTPVVINAKEATATEDGYTGDTICSVCQEPLETGEIIPATGAQEERPTQQGDNLCKWCGQPHTGTFGAIIAFFHRILYFFAHLFGAR